MVDWRWVVDEVLSLRCYTLEITIFVRSIDNENEVVVRMKPSTFFADVIESALPKLGWNLAPASVSIFASLTDAKEGKNKLKTNTAVKDADEYRSLVLVASESILILFDFVWVCLGLFGFVWVCLGLFGFVWVCLLLESFLFIAHFACNIRSF